MKVVPFFENLSPNQCYFKQSFSKIELTDQFLVENYNVSRNANACETKQKRENYDWKFWEVYRKKTKRKKHYPKRTCLHAVNCTGLYE